MSRWSIATATTVGESHIQRGRGSDDAFATLQSGRWSALVVCDGAGSAARAREGADIVSAEFAKQLIRISRQIEGQGPGPWLNDSIISSVLKVRTDLTSVAQSFDLSEFHCTLVAALISDTGGFSVHIGDGAIFVGRRKGLASQIELHSSPENGEYSNETYFITETTWLKNLRIRPLGACDWVMLTTDGAASLFLDRDIKFEVISGLLGAVSNEKSLTKVEDDLSYLLESDDAKACSNDDKSIILGFRDFTALTDYEIERLEHAPLTEKRAATYSPALSGLVSIDHDLTQSEPVLSRARNSLLLSATLGFISLLIFGALSALIYTVFTDLQIAPNHMPPPPYGARAVTCFKVDLC